MPERKPPFRTDRWLSDGDYSGSCQRSASLLVAICVIALLTASSASGQTDEPLINSKTGLDVAQAYGYYLAQSHSLNHIAVRFPGLAQKVALAKTKFDLGFKSSIDNMEAIFSRQGAKWTELITKISKQIKENSDLSDLTKGQAENFLLSVEERANGDMPSPVIETFLLFSPKYLQNPTSEFVDGFKKRYSSVGADKADGLRFHVDYPQSWSSQEGNRPHVVTKFISENGRGHEMVIVSVKALPSSLAGSEAQISSALLESLQETLPPNATLLEGGSIRIDNLPGVFQKYNVTAQQMDFTVYASVIAYTLHYRGKAIQLQCSVGCTEKNSKELGRRFRKFEPLFRQVANSFVVQSQWK